jgi:hypothetical protein
VTATGIVSRALALGGTSTASAVLFGIAVALCLGLLTAPLAEAVHHADVIRAELRDSHRLFGRFTLVAAAVSSPPVSVTRPVGGLLLSEPARLFEGALDLLGQSLPLGSEETLGSAAVVGFEWPAYWVSKRCSSARAVSMTTSRRKSAKRCADR